MWKWLALVLVVGVLSFSGLPLGSSSSDSNAIGRHVALAIALLALGAAALLAGVPGEERRAP